MILYVRYQDEEFAWKKWGSQEVFDAEYGRRIAIKKTENQKFEESHGSPETHPGKRMTKRQDAEHKHVYGPVENGTQVCHACELTIDVEEF
jgi:DNA-repair protein complementing XP-A cells